MLTADGADLTSADGDPTRTLIRQVLGAVAQFEKSVIVLKLRAAREIAFDGATAGVREGSRLARDRVRLRVRSESGSYAENRRASRGSAWPQLPNS